MRKLWKTAAVLAASLVLHLAAMLAISGCGADSGCPTGSINCPSGCSQLDDTQNCGACGQACAEGQVCQRSICYTLASAGCPKNTMACGEVCADLRLDNSHCGGCNNPCAYPKSCYLGGCRN